MNRTPPIHIRRLLRKEVGFGCPVENCGRPYLEWHHFDPPWHEREHHNPEGMIALCGEHHKKADSGAYTKEQLMELKANVFSKNIEGRFDWLRNEILVVMGGDFYLEPNILLRYKGESIIWFTKDEDGNFLLNINMVTSSSSPRFTMEENFWQIIEEPVDIESPPSGKTLEVTYSNKDYIKIEFNVIKDKNQFIKRFKKEPSAHVGLTFPITVVDIMFSDIAAKIEFDTKKSNISGLTISGNWWTRVKYALNF